MVERKRKPRQTVIYNSDNYPDTFKERYKKGFYDESKITLFGDNGDTIKNYNTKEAQEKSFLKTEKQQEINDNKIRDLIKEGDLRIKLEKSGKTTKSYVVRNKKGVIISRTRYVPKLTKKNQAIRKAGRKYFGKQTAGYRTRIRANLVVREFKQKNGIKLSYKTWVYNDAIVLKGKVSYNYMRSLLPTTSRKAELFAQIQKIIDKSKRIKGSLLEVEDNIVYQVIENATGRDIRYYAKGKMLK